MSTDSDREEQTQPIKVQVNQSPSEDTSRTNLVSQKPDFSEEIPEWLLEFASEPAQDARAESQHGLEAIEEPAPEPVEAVAPIVLETAEWHVVQAELETTSSAIIEDQRSFPIEPNVHDLLSLGDYVSAAHFIRKTATTKDLAQESQRTLRSHLVLQEDRSELWNVYDELSEIIKRDDRQTESTEEEWKDR